MAKYHLTIDMAGKCTDLDTAQYAKHPFVLWQGNMVMPPAGQALELAWNPDTRTLHLEYAPSELYKNKMAEWMAREDVRVAATAGVIA
ncbi:unnamed protein product, partial [marine sediment metagenome]